MKIRYAAISVAILAVNGCSAPSPGHRDAGFDTPETVRVIYHVKPGNEAELENVLVRAWQIYRKEGLVFEQPHVIFRDKEDGKPRAVEIFTWVNHRVPERAPASVQAVWNELQALCEARDGHLALEGGEVELVTPKPR